LGDIVLIIDPEILNHFTYDPETGVFTRLPRSGGHKHKAGRMVTTTSKGYLRIKWRKKDYSAGRVAFKFMGVDVPDGMCVDHLNGDRMDNRFRNLRIVTKRENEINRKEHRSGKAPGVREHNGRFEVNISWFGKRYFIGTFRTEGEASVMYNRIFRILEDGRRKLHSDRGSQRQAREGDIL
jgi:hypothetical protein